MLRHAEVVALEPVTLGEGVKLAGAREFIEQVRRVRRDRVGAPDAVQPAAADAVAVGLVRVVTARVAAPDASLGEL